MIVVTGGAGFIGSAFVWELNQAGRDDIVIVDELGTEEKWLNLQKRSFREIVHIDDFGSWLVDCEDLVDSVVHMGACSTTTEPDMDFLVRNNIQYSMELFRFCAEKEIPFVYASSAATYGQGEHGYSDGNASFEKLRPINKYGFSKHVFDRWLLSQLDNAPPIWAGLKFFNVLGPNEYHKGSQASVVCHAYQQASKDSEIKLFKSYEEGYAHGEQKRDFVYIKDVTKVMMHFLESKDPSRSGIYNVGTGNARTFLDLAHAVYGAMGISDGKVSWIEMPDNVRSQYQYFTEADLTRLREQGGYRDEFTGLEDAVNDYVQNYLADSDPYL